MAIKGSAAELEKYLKGVNYPVDKNTLLRKAKANGAPEEVCHMIENLHWDEFRSPIDVSKAFGETR